MQRLDWESMKVIILAFTLLFSQILFAQEKGVIAQNGNERIGLQSGVDFDNDDPNMDALYQRGAYLVYDCFTNHWVCTDELEYNRCKIQRKEALLDYKNSLPCAYFDQYKTRKKCQNAQTQLTNEARFEVFCTHPTEKKMSLN